MKQRPWVPAPPFILQHTNLVGRNAEDGLVELSLLLAPSVIPRDDHLHHFVCVAHFPALQNAQEGRQAALAEQHLAETKVAIPRHGTGEEHVEFHDEQVSEVEVLLGPVVCIAEKSIAVFVGR